MNSQLKPGDLVLIVGCDKDPRDIGKCAELVELLEPGQISIWVEPNTLSQVISGCPIPVWLIIADSIMSSTGHRGHTLCAPEHLRPLRGDRDPVRQDKREMVV